MEKGTRIPGRRFSEGKAGVWMGLPPLGHGEYSWGSGLLWRGRAERETSWAGM